MHIGNFSLMIPEGVEGGSGHVTMQHNQVYTLNMINHDHSRRCDAIVVVDGKRIGGYRLNCGEAMRLECPSNEEKGRFTFLREDSKEAAEANVGGIANPNRGLITVEFRPERYPYTPRTKSSTIRPTSALRGGDSSAFTEDGTTPTSYEPEEKTSGGIDPHAKSAGPQRSMMGFAPKHQQNSQMGAGITGLTGHSSQGFYNVPDLDWDPAKVVIINLRLVHRTGVRELMPQPAGNAIPLAVS